MDVLLHDDPELFERYALQDAVIAARYLQKIWDVLPKLGVDKPVPTLGAAAVMLIRKAVENLGNCRTNISVTCAIAGESLFAESHRGMAVRLELLSRRPQRSLLPRLHAHRTNLYDVDLTSAYTTAMAMIRVPDWESANKKRHRKARSRIRGHDLRSCEILVSRRKRFPASSKSRDRGLVIR